MLFRWNFNGSRISFVHMSMYMVRFGCVYVCVCVRISLGESLLLVVVGFFWWVRHAVRIKRALMNYEIFDCFVSFFRLSFSKCSWSLLLGRSNVDVFCAHSFNRCSIWYSAIYFGLNVECARSRLWPFVCKNQNTHVHLAYNICSLIIHKMLFTSINGLRALHFSIRRSHRQWVSGLCACVYVMVCVRALFVN